MHQRVRILFGKRVLMSPEGAADRLARKVEFPQPGIAKALEGFAKLTGIRVDPKEHFTPEALGRIRFLGNPKPL